MKNLRLYQRGLILTTLAMAIVGGVIAATVIGGITYHTLVTGGLKKEIKECQEKNTKLVTANTKLTAQNDTLKEANTSLGAAVDQQNIAVEKMLSDRKASDAKWQQALRQANKESFEFQTNITGILAFREKTGESWCDTWARQSEEYVVKRQKGLKP